MDVTFQVFTQMMSESSFKYVDIRFTLLMGMFIYGLMGFALFLLHLISSPRTKPVWHGLVLWGLAIVLGIIVSMTAFILWEDIKTSILWGLVGASAGPFFAPRWINKLGKYVGTKIG